MINAGGDMVAIGTRAEKERPVARGAILPRERRHMAFDRKFASVHRQARDRAIEPRFGGNVGEQIVDRRCADGGEHRAPIVICQGKVTHELLRRRS